MLLTERILLPLNKIKDGILGGDLKYKESKNKEDPFIYLKNNKTVEDMTSIEELKRVEAEYGDVRAAKMSNSDNRYRYSYRVEADGYSHDYGVEFRDLIKLIASSINEECRISGNFLYPPGAYCGWHTNSNNMGYRIYFVWAEEDKKSFFKSVNPYTKEVVTKWDSKGWNINLFKVDPDKHLWHCVGSHTNRVSIGIKWGDNWKSSYDSPYYEKHPWEDK